MKSAKKKGWKRVCSMILASTLALSMVPMDVNAGTSSVQENSTFTNPVIYSDVPDIDMIRVGDAYYMVSTTMHLSPGCPIMKSTDLVNWEIVNYVYDVLGTGDEMSLRNGASMYGDGQWAASLQYHNGIYYVAFASNTTGKTYIFTTDDIENGSWTRTTLDEKYHDLALFFDDDNGKVYIVYGSRKIQYVEMKSDLTGVLKGGQSGTLFETDGPGECVKVGPKNLGYEGTHIMKKDGYYYVFNICWPQGMGRTEVCHRSKTFPSTEWESKVILDAAFSNNGVTAGVAQGGVIDTADGGWYGFLFQDHGAVGRTPVLTDCTWKDGWPMLGKNGDGKTVEDVMNLPVTGSEEKTLVKSDEFYNDAEHRVFENTASAATASVVEEDSIGNLGAELLSDDATTTETVELIANGDFEGDKGTTGWQAFEAADKAVISVETEGNGNKVLKVSGRKNTSASAMYDLTGRIKKGTTYKVKGKIKYTSGPDTKEFIVRFQNGDTYNHRPSVGSVTAAKGEWNEFEFEYTADDWALPWDKSQVFPFSNSKNYFFIETPYANLANANTDLMDYYLDDISITYEKVVDSGDTPGTDPGTDIPVADDSLIELITNGDIESGARDGWIVTPGENDGATLTAVTDADGATGNYALYVSDRKSTGAGACQNISGKLKWGKTYTISGKLKYTTGPDTKKFYVTIQNGTDYNYRENVVTIEATKNQWTTFSGTYTVHDKSEKYPFDENNNYIFVENPWSANPSAGSDYMNYYLDDFSMTTTSDNMIKNGSFENGTTGWTGCENGTILQSSEEKQDGTYSVKTTNRTACAQGPSQDLSNKLTPGNIYTITAYIKYNEGVDKKTFNATIQNGPDYRYRTVLGSITAKKGEWTKLEATYTMPDDAITTENYLFFETPWTQDPTAENDLMDFYVDNVSMIETVPDKKVEESGENDYNGSNLDLVWQWNHNPNNNNWSLTDRSGWLRLTTGDKVSSILNARNTLTQRTYGPTCSGKIKMDISNMKVGDVAGLASFSYNYGYIAAKKESSGTKLIMVDATSNSTKKEDDPQVIETVDCASNIIYLKEDFNFAGVNGGQNDTVTFYYSFDGANWTKLGDTIHLSYELTHFMGSRFAIFNYATKSSGGYVDFDYFRVSDEITGASQSEGSAMAASMTGKAEVLGVVNTEYEAKLCLDELASGKHTSLKASVAIPDGLTVEDVVFNKAAIKGETGYSYKNGRLTLSVSGSDVSFAAEDRLFATLKLKVKNYADKDKNVSIKTDYIMVDGGKSEYDVTKCAVNMTMKYLDTGAIAKKLGYGNPIMTQELGADPYAIVYKGRVYVYMTADDYEYDADGNLKDNSFGYIKTLRVVSSDDMLNWTDHGSIAVAGENGAAKWASHAWAPAIAYNKVNGKDKFFLYFANDASGIGVLEADTPLGPWKDPIGKALITGQTPGCQGVVWCFDPAVLVDDDGSAYIYFGGGVPDGQQLHPKSARVAKLGADMISIDGEAKLIDAPCMFEDSGIFKRNRKYYYSYCSNFTGPHGDGYPGFGTICYMVSDNPMGPYTYAGEIFENPQVWFGVGGNNHHATFVFNGQTYFIYHAQTVAKELDKAKGYRSTHIDNIEFNSDGTIKPIKGTYAGIEQLKTVNPYERIDAETIAWNKGIKTEDCAEEGKLFKDYNRNLTDLQDGDWTSVADVDFGSKGAKEFKVYAASEKGGSIEIRLDSPEGELIGTANVPATGSDKTYQMVTTAVTNVTGTRNVFLVFKGTDENIMNVDYYLFTEKSEGGTGEGGSGDAGEGGSGNAGAGGSGTGGSGSGSGSSSTPDSSAGDKNDSATTTNPGGTTTETKTETTTNESGKEVETTVTTKKDADGKVTGSTEVSTIAGAAKNTTVTVTVEKDAKGNVAEAAAEVTRKGTETKEGTKGTISAAVVQQIKEAAGSENVAITTSVTGADGKEKYSVTVSADDLVAGAKLTVVVKDAKTGKAVLVDAKQVKVTAKGNVSVVLPEGKDYTLIDAKEAAKVTKEILKTVEPAKTSATLKAGKASTAKLSKKLDMDNVKKITYTSSKKSVATVNKNGKVVAKKAGTATITIQVTLNNGKTKTVKMKYKVK
ncbi:MAG: family 43 glycosylhydrolase [Lachnospiraceae bacterium]|nr:family 43 glycosylhydrolase [Lachnospiraceae bacterium]